MTHNVAMHFHVTRAAVREGPALRAEHRLWANFAADLAFHFLLPCGQAPIWKKLPNSKKIFF